MPQHLVESQRPIEPPHPLGLLSSRVANLHASPIREILAVIDRPGMISFAGGLPAADTFPRLSLASFPSALMQYGSSEGEPELRERIAEDLAAIGLRCSPQQVLILSGSQQGIDLAAKLFIDPGTGVGVKSPTYLAALQVMRFFGARFIPYDPRRGATWSAPDSGATLRLNFSHADELETERGLAILAALLMACR